MQHVAFSGRLVMLGFGSIGQGGLPLILRHIDFALTQISIVTGNARGARHASQPADTQATLARDPVGLLPACCTAA